MTDKPPGGEARPPKPQPAPAEISKTHLRNWEIESGANRLGGAPVVPSDRKD